MHWQKTIEQLRQSLIGTKTTDSIFNFIKSSSTSQPYRSARLSTSKVLSTNIFEEIENQDWQNSFQKDYQVWQQLDAPQQESTAFYFLQKYGCKVPFSDTPREGVSFFDQLRINEAINACGETEYFLIIKGDLSGIQDFIYSDITKDQAGAAQNTAKQLRGKSFFVSLLTNILADHLLATLELRPWHLIFAGGGHFQILVPQDSRAKLKKWTKMINLQLSKQFSKRLSLVVASISCDKNTFTDASLISNDINHQISIEKYRQHNEYLKELFYPEQNAKARIKKQSKLHFSKVGGRIPKSDYLVQVFSSQKVDFEKSIEEKSIYELEPFESELFPCQYIFIIPAKDKDTFLADLDQRVGSNQISITLLKVNDTDFLPNTTSTISPNISYGFTFIGKHTPMNNENDLLDFGEFTPINPDDRDNSFDRIAAFRLDVDNLGDIFGSGLDKEHNSLAHYATLSREMSLFFSGYFNRIAKRHQCYIVYSGGDDAFVIGHWLNCIEFAQDLYKDFKDFVRHNPAVHFSGGFYFCHSNYPIFNLARDAEILEDKAKKNKGKNSIAVFGQVLSWEEFLFNIQFGKNLIPHISDKTISKDEQTKLAKSLVHRLLRIIQSCFYERDTMDKGSFQKQGNINLQRLHRNIASLHYLFARHGFTEQKIEKAKDIIKKDLIKNILFLFKTGEDIRLKKLTLTLNYLLLRLRRKPQRKKS